MNIVITMAGRGSRFKEAGYAVPKFQIEARGKTLFEWSMLSLAAINAPENRNVFIVRAEDDSKAFIAGMCAKMNIAAPIIKEIDCVTDGQATTAMLAAPYWDAEAPLLVYNIDTFVRPGAMRPGDFRGDGFIPCFLGEGDHWSFVKLGTDGRAVEVREKRRISPNCTLGAYYFRSARLYEDLYGDFFQNGAGREKGEKYIAPMYNRLIERGGEVYISLVDRGDVFVLGTPAELCSFNANYRP